MKLEAVNSWLGKTKEGRCEMLRFCYSTIIICPVEVACAIWQTVICCRFSYLKTTKSLVFHTELGQHPMTLLHFLQALYNLLQVVVLAAVFTREMRSLLG